MKHKFAIGDTVEVTADVVFKGLKGTVYFSDKDEEGNNEYRLKDIECPKMIDKNGKEYEFTRNLFYEAWLTKK
jgi:hypothetical protein